LTPDPIPSTKPVGTDARQLLPGTRASTNTAAVIGNDPAYRRDAERLEPCI
jgi:hypothetical protein